MEVFRKTKLSLNRDCPPRLIAVIDTEEEFDWYKPFSRDAQSVSHMRSIGRLQSIFERSSVRPIYVVDYPVAAQREAWQPLRSLAEAGSAAIGAHLHPWVTPPHLEKLSSFNSYHGNLSWQLELAKIANLTQLIRQNFNVEPRSFKAGRYGLGPHTYRSLAETGYKIDLSPTPPFDWSADGGPDYSRETCEPYQDEASGLLVLPNSGSFIGWMSGRSAGIHRWATSSWRAPFHANALLNRSGAIHRVTLTPEGFSLERLIAVTQTLLNRGIRVFVISLHSPSIMAGGTPYTPDAKSVTHLLGTLQEYLAYFFGELRGQAWTPDEALEYWSGQPGWSNGAALSAAVAGDRLSR